jgi:hypothetical protein
VATVQDIITYANRKFSNSESDANKIIDLDGIHKRIFLKLSRLTNSYVKHEDVTIADQLTYTLPTDCLPENIILIQVSDSTGENWYDFKYAGLKDYISDDRYWTKDTVGTYALLEYGEVVSENDRGIVIYYYKTPTTLSAVNNTPELNPLYHDLLKFALIQEIASQGHNPDTEIADFYQRKYDEFMREVESNLYDAASSRPTRRCVAEEDW